MFNYENIDKKTLLFGDYLATKNFLTNTYGMLLTCNHLQCKFLWFYLPLFFP